MNMQVTIEDDLTGPMRTMRAQQEVRDLVEKSADLEEAATRLRSAGYGIYKGGSHVAIHPTHLGKFANGSRRVALVTPK